MLVETGKQVINYNLIAPCNNRNDWMPASMCLTSPRYGAGHSSSYRVDDDDELVTATQFANEEGYDYLLFIDAVRRDDSIKTVRKAVNGTAIYYYDDLLDLAARTSVPITWTNVGRKRWDLCIGEKTFEEALSRMSSDVIYKLGPNRYISDDHDTELIRLASIIVKEREDKQKDERRIYNELNGKRKYNVLYARRRGTKDDEYRGKMLDTSPRKTKPTKNPNRRVHDYSPYLTLKEGAERINVCRKALADACDKGYIKAIETHGRIRVFTIESLNEYKKSIDGYTTPQVYSLLECSHTTLDRLKKAGKLVLITNIRTAGMYTKESVEAVRAELIERGLIENVDKEA